jgi:glycosyltransferase involved in cell wall biosynthesis
MSSPRISVIMSVYNAGKYVKEAVESILGQTFSDLEFIIVDDGSTDGSGKVLSAFRDPRIRLVHQENRGLITSLNAGVEMARGEYIARQDADDVSLPERLEKQVTFLDIHPEIAIVGTSVIETDEDGDLLKVYNSPEGDAEIKKALSFDVPVCHASMMFRKSLIKDAGLYREKLRLVEDYDLLIRVGERSKLGNIREPLYKVRIRPGSVCSSNRFDLQRRYVLVRKLSEERARTGKDSLDAMTELDVDRALEEIMPRTAINTRRSEALNFLFMAEVSYCTRKWKRAWKWLLKSILFSPLNVRSWVLAAKLLVSWALPSKRGHV